MKNITRSFFFWVLFQRKNNFTCGVDSSKLFRMFVFKRKTEFFTASEFGAAGNEMWGQHARETLLFSAGALDRK